MRKLALRAHTLRCAATQSAGGACEITRTPRSRAEGAVDRPQPICNVHPHAAATQRRRSQAARRRPAGRDRARRHARCSWARKCGAGRRPPGGRGCSVASSCSCRVSVCASNRKTVLELGCGTGLYTEQLAAVLQDARRRRHQRDAARSRRASRCPPSTSASCGRTSRTIDASQTGRGFEAVFGCSVLHHLDLDQTLPQLAALLAPGRAAGLLGAEPAEPASARHVLRAGMGEAQVGGLRYRDGLLPVGAAVDLRASRLRGVRPLPVRLHAPGDSGADSCRWRSPSITCSNGLRCCVSSAAPTSFTCACRLRHLELAQRHPAHAQP